MIAERAGYDAISVSSGGSHYESTIASMYFDPGYLVPAAHRIRQAVTIPVIAVGRIDARLAEQVIAEGKADFVLKACAARLSASEAYDTAARDAVQIHGGIGVTWQLGLHLHMRRARSLSAELGSPLFWEDLLVSELETGAGA